MDAFTPPEHWGSDALLREHPDPAAATLGALPIDRQRVVQSAAFRRLQHKTQAFVTGRDDHYRTRLTHTLEVAHLARLLAARLGASEDLAEVASLAHDLGHPPFGHAGERALNECLRDHGGFEHNAHALRVVEYLEHPYPQFRGLNLTRVVRRCLAAHSTRFDHPAVDPPAAARPAPLEGRIAAVADQLAYTLHDLSDGAFAGLIQVEMLSSIELWRCARDESPTASEWLRHLRPTLDRMQEQLIDDLAHTSTAREAVHGPAPAAMPELRFSAAMQHDLDRLNELLTERVYRDHQLVRMDRKAERIIRALFDEYVRQPGLMPPRFAARAQQQGAARVAADYIAGMTDRFCLREHARLFDPSIDA